MGQTRNGAVIPFFGGSTPLFCGFRGNHLFLGGSLAKWAIVLVQIKRSLRVAERCRRTAIPGFLLV